MSLVKSTATVMLSTIISRVLGLARDMLMAAHFGAGRRADAFYVAFMIPNLFRRLVAEGALTVSFIPVCTETLINEGETGALALGRVVFTFQMAVIIAIILPGIFFSDWIMRPFFGIAGSGEILPIAVSLARLMFPYLLMSGFVAFSMGWLNSRGVFFAPAFAPVLLNIGMISGIVWLGGFFPEPVYGAAVGVLLGGMLQVMLQIPYLIRNGFRFRLSFDAGNPGAVRVFRMLVPAMFGLAVYQVNILAGSMMAAWISEGSVTYIYYTNRLTELVLGIFIISIGNVVLPEMSKLAAADDIRGFRDMFSKSVSSALFISVPAAAGLVTLGIPVVSVLFMHGRFSYQDVIMTDRSLVCAGAGIVFFSVVRILTQASYSMNDAGAPVKAATVSMVLNIVLGYFLMHTDLRHAGLVLAGSIAAAVQMLVLLLYISRRAGSIDIGAILLSLKRSVMASAAMLIFIIPAVYLTDWSHARFHLRCFILAVIVSTGASVYFYVSALLGSPEAYYAFGSFKKVFRRLKLPL